MNKKVIHFIAVSILALLSWQQAGWCEVSALRPRAAIKPVCASVQVLRALAAGEQEALPIYSKTFKGLHSLTWFFQVPRRAAMPQALKIANDLYAVVMNRLRWTSAQDSTYLTWSGPTRTIRMPSNAITMPIYEAVMNAIMYGGGGRVEVRITGNDLLAVKVINKTGLLEGQFSTALMRPTVPECFEWSMRVHNAYRRGVRELSGYGFYSITMFPRTVEIIDGREQFRTVTTKEGKRRWHSSPCGQTQRYSVGMTWDKKWFESHPFPDYPPGELDDLSYEMVAQLSASSVLRPVASGERRPLPALSVIDIEETLRELKQTNTVEFDFYARDENGQLLHDPSGFPGDWLVEIQVTGERPSEASIVRAVKSFSLAMVVEGRRDIAGARFLVVDELPPAGEDNRVQGAHFCIRSSDERGVEVFMTPAFLAYEPLSQRSEFARNAASLPAQKKVAPPQGASGRRALSAEERSHRKVLVFDNPFNAVSRNYSPLMSTSVVLAGLIKNAGYGVQISRLQKEEDEEIILEAMLRKELAGVDVVCLTMYEAYTEELQKLTARLRKIKPDLIIIGGGPLATIMPEHAAAHLPELNCVYRGNADTQEGLIPLLDDLLSLPQQPAPELLCAIGQRHPGTLLRAGDYTHIGELLHINRASEADINARPFDFSFLKKEDIVGPLSLLTGEGCEWGGCDFCVTGGGTTYRGMSPERVIEIARAYQRRLIEIEAETGEQFGPQEWSIGLHDDNILQRPERFFTLCDLWRAAGLKVRIGELQTGIMSFLEPRDDAGGLRVNESLLERIASYRDIFLGAPEIVVGSDAFIDGDIRAIKHLPYTFAHIEEFVALCEKNQIANRHYLIATSQRTTPAEAMITYLRGARLAAQYSHFRIAYTNVGIIPQVGTAALNRVIRNKTMLFDYDDKPVAPLRAGACGEYDLYVHTICHVRSPLLTPQTYDALYTTESSERKTMLWLLTHKNFAYFQLNQALNVVRALCSQEILSAAEDEDFLRRYGSILESGLKEEVDAFERAFSGPGAPPFTPVPRYVREIKEYCTAALEKIGRVRAKWSGAGEMPVALPREVTAAVLRPVAARDRAGTGPGLRREPTPLDKIVAMADGIIELIIEDPGEALSILWKNRTPSVETSWVAIEKIVNEKRKEAVLTRLEDRRYRFNQQGYIQHRVVPDGDRGYDLDTVGTPGEWDISFDLRDPDAAESAMALRVIDTLSDIVHDDRGAQSYGELGGAVITESLARPLKVHIMETMESVPADIPEGAKIYASADEPGLYCIRSASGEASFYIARKVIAIRRRHLRTYLRKALAHLKACALPAVPMTGLCSYEQVEETVSESIPPVLMACQSKLAVPVLRHAVEMKGIPVRPIELQPPLGEDYRRKGWDQYRWPACGSTPVLILSIYQTREVTWAQEISAEFRKAYPEGHIIAGGTFVTNQPKSAITLLPDVDIFMRGMGEDELPALISIVGSSKRSQGYAARQIEAFRKRRGVSVRTPRRMLVSRLDEVNEVRGFDVPVLAYTGTEELYFNAWNIERGCPEGCGFCDLCMGVHPHFAGVDKMKEHILNKLGLRFNIGLEPLFTQLQEDEVRSMQETDGEFSPHDGYAKDRVVDIIREADRLLRATRLGGFPSEAFAEIAAKFGLREGASATLDSFISALPRRATLTQVRYMLFAGQRLLIERLLEEGEDLSTYGINAATDHLFGKNLAGSSSVGYRKINQDAPWKIRQFFFGDNSFGYKAHIEEFCHWAIGVGLKRYVGFTAFNVTVQSLLAGTDPDAPADDRFMRDLKEAGFERVDGVGSDGTSNEILDDIGKARRPDGSGKYTFAGILRVNNALRRAGLDATFHQMYSGPYSRVPGIVESVAVAAMTPLVNNAHAIYVWSMLGSDLTNRYIIDHPERFALLGENRDPSGRRPIDNGHFGSGSNFSLICAGYPEYLLLGNRAMPCDDQAGQWILRDFAQIANPSQVPHRVLGLLDGHSAALRRCVDEWAAPGQADPEMFALGSLIKRALSGNDLAAAFIKVHNRMLVSADDFIAADIVDIGLCRRRLMGESGLHFKETQEAKIHAAVADILRAVGVGVRDANERECAQAFNTLLSRRGLCKELKIYKMLHETMAVLLERALKGDPTLTDEDYRRLNRSIIEDAFWRAVRPSQIYLFSELWEKIRREDKAPHRNSAACAVLRPMAARDRAGRGPGLRREPSPVSLESVLARRGFNVLGKEALLDRGIALFANAQSRQTRVCLAVLQDALYSPIGREGIMVHAGYSVLVLGDPRSTGEMLGIISKDANTCFVVAILASLPDGRIACVVSHLGENAPLGDPDESDLVLATLGPLVQIMIEGLGVPKNNILVVPINKRSERGSRYMSKVCSFFDEQRIAYERDFIDAVGVARTGVRVDMRARVVEAMGRKALRVSPRQERWTTIGRKALRSVPSVRRAGPLDAAVLRSAALYTKLSTIADSLIEIVVEDPAEAVGIIRRMYHENPALDIMIKAIVNEKRKVAVLDRIADPRIRFNEQGYVQRRVVPDGRGGYLIDTVAPEGSWDVQIGGERPEEVTSVSVLCAIDALSDIIFNQRRPQSYGAFERGRLSADKEKVIRLCIVDSLSASAADTGRRALFYSEEHPDVAVATADDGTCTFFMSRLFIEGSRPQMRRDMRAAFARFAEHPIPERVAGMPIAVPSLEFSSSAQVSTVMMAETGALGLGGNIVRHAIEAQGTPVLKVDPAQWPALVSDPILLLTVEQTNVLEVREITRSFKKKYPGGRIIAGGSFISNQFKAAIALLPGIDIFIRGEGEDVLPGVVAAIKGADRGAVYSLEALKALTSNGGIFARSPRRMLLHRLDRVNEAEDIEIPVLDYPDLPFMHQEAWNIDRGCPHECGFCDICMGTRLRYAKLEKLKGHLIARLALSLRVGLFDHLEALRSDERNLVTDPVSGFTRPVSFNGYTHRQVETIIRSADEVLRAYGLSGYTSTVCAGLAQRIHLSPASAASLETFIAALPERVTVTQAREILLAGQCLLVDDLLEKKMDLTAFGATVSDGFPVRYSEIDYSGFVAAMMADAPFRERVLNETRMRLGLPDDRSDRTVIIRYAIEIINTFLERSDPLSFPVAAEAPDGKFDREMRYMRAAFLRAGGRLTDAERITFNRAFLQKHCPGILGPHPKKLKQVFFGDNAFGRKDRVRALCEWIKAMGLDAYFQLGAFDVTIPSLLVREPGAAHAVPDEGFIRLLKEAGFTGLYGIGYDGRTNELLRQLGKIRTGSGEPSYQVFQVLQINDLLWRIGIDADYHQMYGTPYSGIKRDGGKGQGIADILEGVLLAAMTSVDYNAHAVYVWSMLGSEITNRFIVEHPEEFDFGRPGTPCSWYPDENGVAAIKLIDNGAYGDTYGMTMIPPAHPEYLLLGQRPMRCENPAGRRVLEAFRDITQPYQEPDRVFEIARDYPEDLEEVIQGWLSPEQSDPEMRALGVLVERYDTGSGRLDALLRIHHDMRERRIHLFEKFLQRMMEGDPAALREHADSAVLRPTAYAQTSRYRLDRIRAEIDRLDGERRAWNESDLRKHRGILSYLRLLDKEESVVVAEHMIERAMDPKFPPCEVNHDMTGDIYELCRDDERWFLIFAERLAVLMIRYADNPRSHQPFKEIALHLIAISRQDPARFPLAVFMEKIPSDTCMLFLRAPIIDQIGVSDESGIDVWCDRKSGLRLRSFGHEHHFMMTMLTDIGEHPAAYVTLHREPLTGMSQALFVDVLPVMNAGTETGRIALRQLAIWLQQRAGPGGYIVSQYPVHEFMIYFFLQTLLHNGAIERLEAGLLDMNVLNSAVVLRAGVWDEVTTRRDIRRCFPKVAGQYLFLRGTVPHEAPQHIDGRYRADAV